MGSWLRRLMAGRYGGDELSLAALIGYLILCMFGILTDSVLVKLAALGLILWAFYRIFSRNLPARQAENQAFLRWLRRLADGWRAKRAQRQDKAHRYYRCRDCGAVLRVPRGVGRIEITCPKCGKKMKKKV